MTAAIDVLDVPAGDQMAADLGLGVGGALYREVERLRTHGQVSWGGNLAQSMQYLAARAVTALDASP